MKLILWLAVLAYLSGASVMLAASGFPMLFVGSLLMAMGDGLVQSAANPMTTTLFADRKTEMINKLHLAFAVGVALFGLVVYGLGDGLWQAKLVLVIVPTAVFGADVLRPEVSRDRTGADGRFFRPDAARDVSCGRCSCSWRCA